MRWVMVSLLVAGAAYGSDMEAVRGISVDLVTGQPPNKVRQLLGRPDRTQNLTCGAKTRRPFNCLVWIYEDTQSTGPQLWLTFVIDSGAYRLNGWTWN